MFVGTLQPRKNLANLLAAHALLPESLRQAHPLVVVGRNGWGVEDLLPKLQALSETGTVRWLDYLPEDHVIVLLQQALALCFLSLYEGFGLPILEAFAAGCPVIASNSTSIPEVAGDAATLVDPLSPPRIAEAMMALIQDENRCLELKNKGKNRAALFTWGACAAKTWKVYEQVYRQTRP